MGPLETFLAVLAATVAVVLWISIRYWGTKTAPPLYDEEVSPRSSAAAGSSRGSTRTP